MSPPKLALDRKGDVAVKKKLLCITLAAVLSMGILASGQAYAAPRTSHRNSSQSTTVRYAFHQSELARYRKQLDRLVKRKEISLRTADNRYAKREKAYLNCERGKDWCGLDDCPNAPHVHNRYCQYPFCPGTVIVIDGKPVTIVPMPIKTPSPNR